MMRSTAFLDGTRTVYVDERVVGDAPRVHPEVAHQLAVQPALHGAAEGRRERGWRSDERTFVCDGRRRFRSNGCSVGVAVRSPGEPGHGRHLLHGTNPPASASSLLESATLFRGDMAPTEPQAAKWNFLELRLPT